MFKKKLKEFFLNPVSVMVIPDSTKKTRQFKFIKGFVVLPSAAFLIYFCFIQYENIRLKNIENDYELVVANEDSKIKAIRADYESQITIRDDKIYDLSQLVKQKESDIQAVKDKVSQLTELESQVRNMVGLSPMEEAAEATLEVLADDAITEEAGANDEDLVNLVSSAYEHYDEFMASLEKQLDILDATPDLWPVKGRISSKFGYRIHPISKKKQFHKGIDIVEKTNTNVKAAGSGVVTFAGWNSGYGNVVKISHGYGYQSVYAHNNKLVVKVGDKVEKGDTIAKLGSTGMSTGPHVHFEIHYQGKQINPEEVLKDK